ncbi:type II toxin-antitoxin system VapC family toxin [Aquibium microcysteis]|uniref:type II toxin-antitoxin system VapC family toxin n=1 Tax=Aquibium microcysteis TaxID=675281 RepID=UPI00165CF5F5|nr:type II toxin-antitoxin system VapC family toxin [Aquibium microcysteis]
MFVDACVIISLMAGEDTAAAYEAALEKADSPFTSPLAAWEAIIAMSRPDQLDCPYSATAALVVDWLAERQIELREPISPHEVLSHAVAVAERHGLGKRYLSNFDCFHYAHAKAAGVPMLTLDRLLRETDVETLPA